MPENSFNLESSDNLESKAENLEKLVEFLSSIVEMDLSHIHSIKSLFIKGHEIIFQRDPQSVKHLLELILELIMILKQDQDPDHDQDQDQDHDPEDDNPEKPYVDKNRDDYIEDEIYQEEDDEGHDGHHSGNRDSYGHKGGSYHGESNRKDVYEAEEQEDEIDEAGHQIGQNNSDRVGIQELSSQRKSAGITGKESQLNEMPSDSQIEAGRSNYNYGDQEHRSCPEIQEDISGSDYGKP